MKTHVYVAGKFEEKQAVRRIQDLFRARGHHVTHDWTTCDVAHAGAEGVHKYLASCAQADVTGVQMADAIVVLHHEKGCGMLVEVGVALGGHVPVVVVGAKVDDGAFRAGSPIFYHLPYVKHVATAEAAVAAVEELYND